MTASQTQVAQLVAKGRSNREIAAALGLTTGTVKQYIQRVCIEMAITPGARRVKLANLMKGKQ